MNVRWLQDFLTIAETGNFTRAAELRNASQPAFSRRIQSLETWLGVSLIDRNQVPTQLTEEGKQFRIVASEIVRQAVDARTDLSGKARAQENLVRIGLPYSLSTSRLSHWWQQWIEEQNISAELLIANIHDIVSALDAGNLDVMICFHYAQQPIQLDLEFYDRLVVEHDRLRPYASRSLLDSGRVDWPGTPRKPIPLLMYSSGGYIARLVDIIIDSGPQKLTTRVVLKSEMADVLRDMAIAGHGVAWLPDSTANKGTENALVPLGGSSWAMPLSMVAYRSKKERSRAVDRFWRTIGLAAAQQRRAGN